MPQEIDYLREIVTRCRDGGTLHPELANWLGGCLDAFLTRRVRDIDEAFGLRMGRGGMPWWMEEAVRKRDGALRALARHRNLPPSVRGKARVICDLANRYAASAWRIDKERDEMPPAYAGTPKEYLWIAFRSGAPMPIGERQLRMILGH